MYYFNNIVNNDKKRESIKERKNRLLMINKKNESTRFTRGDILTINFWSKSCNYHFEGICLGLRNKNITKPNTVINLRNVLYNTGVEIIVSYFLNRIYKNLITSDYKRKKFLYRSSKIYYLNNKENQKSRIKS